MLWPAVAVAQGSSPQVLIDPRAELWSVVRSLAPDDVGMQADARASDYARVVRSRFLPYRRHAAIAALRESARGGRGPGRMLESALRLGMPPSWRRVDGGLDEDRDALFLRRFAVETRFGEFLVENERFYRERREKASLDVAREGYLEAFREYAGEDAFQDVRIILLAEGAEGEIHAAVVRRKAGGNEKFLAIGPRRPDGGASGWGLQGRIWEAWGALARLYLDGQVEAAPAASHPFSSVLRTVSQDCYGDWRTCLAEHLAQATATRMLVWADQTGKARGGVWSAGTGLETRLPFLWEFMEHLESYEERRKEYRSLKGFYPIWMADSLARIVSGAKGNETVPSGRRKFWTAESEKAFYASCLAAPFRDSTDLGARTTGLLLAKPPALWNREVTGYFSCLALATGSYEPCGQALTLLTGGSKSCSKRYDEARQALGLRPMSLPGDGSSECDKCRYIVLKVRLGQALADRSPDVLDRCREAGEAWQKGGQRLESLCRILISGRDPEAKCRDLLPDVRRDNPGADMDYCLSTVLGEVAGTQGACDWFARLGDGDKLEVCRTVRDYRAARQAGEGAESCGETGTCRALLTHESRSCDEYRERVQSSLCQWETWNQRKSEAQSP